MRPAAHKVPEGHDGPQDVAPGRESLKARGITVLLIEQNAAAALAIADEGHVLESGRIVLSGTGAEMLRNDKVKAAYLGR